MKQFVAITTPGAEYLYRASTAHMVSRDNAQRIMAALNAAGHMLRQGERWHLYAAEDASAVPYRYIIRSGRLYEQEIWRVKW